MQFARKLVLSVLFQALVVGAAFADAKATADEAKALAEKAVVHIKAVGTDKAFADFGAADSKWRDRELYVTAIAFDGTMLYMGANKAINGKNVIDLKDMNGKYFIKELIEVAKAKGSGWVDYMFSNPTTKKVEPKSTYAVRMQNYDGIVAVGIYK